jgi:hypothetical protein
MSFLGGFKFQQDVTKTTSALTNAQKHEDYTIKRKANMLKGTRR